MALSLGESTELRVRGSGPRLARPLPSGSPGLAESPFWVCFSFITVSMRMEYCGLGKSWHTVDAQQAVALPASCQCLGGPWPPGGSTRVPSCLLGVSSALTTLSSELLTLGIYRNQAQKRHLEAHRY